jgi:hypothetical protein
MECGKSFKFPSKGRDVERGSIAIAILRNAAKEIYSEMIEGH